MRVESFDFAYLLSCVVFLNFLVIFTCQIKAATIGDGNQTHSADDFSDITIFQTDNQKFLVYRDAKKRECYLERTFRTNFDQPPYFRTLLLGNQKITFNDSVYEELSQGVLTYCKNYSMFIREEQASNMKSRRRKREMPQSKKEYFKGQTQTQFISFDSDGKSDKGGTAEAIAEHDKSRATVQGRLGMGQAQSQSRSGDPCEELVGSLRSAGQINSAHSTSQISNIPPNVLGSPQQGANVPGQFGVSSYPSLQSPTGTGTSYLPGQEFNIPSYAPVSPQQGANLPGQFGVSLYPSSPSPTGTGTSYLPGQGSNVPPNASVSPKQGANVPNQFGVPSYPSLQSPTGTSTSHPPGQGSNIPPNTSGSPRQGANVPNQFGVPSYPSLQSSTGISTSYPPGQGPPLQGVNVPGQFGVSSYPSLQSPTGTGTSYLPGQGFNIPSYALGLPQQGANVPGQFGVSLYPSLQSPTGTGTSYPPGQGSNIPPNASGSPKQGTNLPNQFDGMLYPTGIFDRGQNQLGYPSVGQSGALGIPSSRDGQPRTSAGSPIIQRVDSFYPQPSGFLPTQAGTNALQPPYDQGQGGLIAGSGQPIYTFQGSGNGLLQNAGQTGYVPQFGTSSLGYAPGSYSPSQGYIPESNTGYLQYASGLRPAGSNYGQQLGSNQFQPGVGGAYSQQPLYFPQGTSFPSTLPHTSGQIYGSQHGISSDKHPQNLGYPVPGGALNYPQLSGQSIPGGTDFQRSSPTNAGLVPGVETYPQSGATSVLPNGKYPLPTATSVSQGGINPQLGVPVGETHPQIVGNSLPGAGGNPQGGGTSTLGGINYPYGGATSITGGGASNSHGAILTPGGFFSPQGMPVDQTNVNYPQGSTGYSPYSNTGQYIYIPSTGNGGQQLPSGFTSSATNTGVVQGSGQNVNLSSNSQNNSIDTALGESQSLSSLNLNPNGTNAAASAQGKTLNGMAQAQVSGTYTGSFSAQAQTSDNEKSVQTQIFGNTTSASSTSQGKAGKSESQSQIQYNYNTGATLAESQGSGINYNTNSQIEVGNKGGKANAQSTGTGGTSSQAQIGYLPLDPKRKDQIALFEGGGTSSSQNGASSGQSQTQLQGSFKSGISFVGSAQSSAGKSQNRTKLAFDSSNSSLAINDTLDSESISTTEQGPKQILKKENSIVKSTVPLPSVPQNDQKDFSKKAIVDKESAQYQDAIIKSQKYDAYIDRDSIEIKNPLLNTGDLVPGTDNYRIPIGFRGKVTSTAGDVTQASASSLGHAQAQTVLLKPGKGNVIINNRNQSERQKFQNDANLTNGRGKAVDEYLTPTKSDTGEFNADKKFAHSYSSKSSNCGYFTFTCNYKDGSNGRTKICKPGPLTYPDGTPCQ